MDERQHQGVEGSASILGPSQASQVLFQLQFPSNYVIGYRMFLKGAQNYQVYNHGISKQKGLDMNPIYCTLSSDPDCAPLRSLYDASWLLQGVTGFTATYAILHNWPTTLRSTQPGGE